ncbi:hypothetical protein HN018_18085 [Lichenicola cladoniae]|uniref:Uncharacterized protein n=1 Tax=Lichenicola cladoniae TaxID=1484109 RepID=A0A6M8HU42_9PROT|nr:hypothetical protein [Lichenicola cladoniae]QKE91687.1 hypothetical protein HN018_18085 [Lichenicola cladoniae]
MILFLVLFVLRKRRSFEGSGLKANGASYPVPGSLPIKQYAALQKHRTGNPLNMPDDTGDSRTDIFYSGLCDGKPV